MIHYLGYLQEEMGRIPDEKETPPIVETKEITYKIEKYEEKRILWVKACKNSIEKEDKDLQ